ncbi:MAG: HI0074 family nucleotidyltransferase substrate-binding subunit [Bacteroidota bacterium]
MEVDLSSLIKAVIQLRDYWELSQADEIKAQPKLLLAVRAGTIQAFEFTYELAFKTLARHLEDSEPGSLKVKDSSFYDIIRLGNVRGLLNAEISVWKNFRSNRGSTSHAYDNNIAQSVYDSIPDFLNEVEYLTKMLIAQQEND